MSDAPTTGRSGAGVGFVVVFLLILAVVMNFLTSNAAVGQDDAAPMARDATGGAPTLEDILARQRGVEVDDQARSDAIGDPDSAAGIASQLGTLGGASDPELWRALRFGKANVTASNGGIGATTLVQDGGMKWMSWREGPLKTYGGNLLLIMLVALVLFYLTRGKIKIDGEKTGWKIKRFGAVERFGHFAMDLKWVHNNVSWAFMIGLILITVMWILHNIPNRHDMVWLMKGGGMFSKGSHPPARKFNAGQKIIFWIVVLLRMRRCSSRNSGTRSWPL